MRKSLPFVIVGLIALLSAAAIEFLPGTLYFPVVEYSTAEMVRFVLLKHGELDQSSCEQTTGKIVSAIRVSCPTCKYSERCSRGLDQAHRKIISREPLAVPSVRTRGGNVIMTISAPDPQLALSVCKLSEQQSASLPAEKRLLCYPAMALR